MNTWSANTLPTSLTTGLVYLDVAGMSNAPGRSWCTNRHTGTKGVVTNYGEAGGGGLQNGRGGAREVLPLWKGGGRKKF